jgi:hypothetical protein
MIRELLQRSIKMTLAYFDLVDFPLTKEELFIFLWESPPLNYPDFLNFLQDSDFCDGVFESQYGYYFLPGRGEIIEKRRHRLILSETKLKIARRAARLVSFVPFLKAIFVCNTVASEQANEDSDIDFFIITASRRIWIARLLVTFILQIFGLRRTKNKIKDKICLSFYITEDSLDLAKLRVVDDDIHFAFWINQMLPLFDPASYYSRFLQANNWIKQYLPNLPIGQAGRQGMDNPMPPSYISQIPEGGVGALWKKFWEKAWQGSYGDLINNEAKKIQLSKMKFSGNKIERGEDKGVVITDGILKFHEKDTRMEYRQMWKNKIG